MLFMVVEHFRDMPAMRERFQRHGRMLPDGVLYQGSWIDKDASRCFQVMDAPNLDSLMLWVRRWDDLVDFEITEVVTSQEYWAANAQPR